MFSSAMRKRWSRRVPRLGTLQAVNAFVLVGMLCTMIIGPFEMIRHAYNIREKFQEGILTLGTGRSTIEAFDVGGVHHYRLAGSLNDTVGNGTNPGVLHLYIKAIVDARNHTQLRGFALFESLAWELRRATRKPGPQLESPFEMFSTFRLRLRSNELDQDRDVHLSFFPCAGRQLKHPDGSIACAPFEPARYDVTRDRRFLRVPEFRVDFGPLPSEDWELAVEGWTNDVQLAHVLRTAARAPARPRRVVWKVIKPMFSLDDDVAPALDRILEYEAAVGMRGTFFYVRDGFLSRLESHPRLQSHLASGRLRLVRWSGYHTSRRETNVAWEAYDQQVVNNHAMLSLWGTGALAFMADMDETLALPSPGVTLDQALDGCVTRARTKAADQSRDDLAGASEGGQSTDDGPGATKDGVLERKSAEVHGAAKERGSGKDGKAAADAEEDNAGDDGVADDGQEANSRDGDGDGDDDSDAGENRADARKADGAKRAFTAAKKDRKKKGARELRETEKATSDAKEDEGDNDTGAGGGDSGEKDEDGEPGGSLGDAREGSWGLSEATGRAAGRGRSAAGRNLASRWLQIDAGAHAPGARGVYLAGAGIGADPAGGQCSRLWGFPVYTVPPDGSRAERPDGAVLAEAPSVREAMARFLYVDRDSRWSKSLVDPDVTVGLAVHDAGRCVGPLKTLELNSTEPLLSPCAVCRPPDRPPPDCLFFLHLGNFHRVRSSPRNTSQRFVDWQWVLQN